ncbi:fatty acid desaturase family protein [Nostoc sp. ChiSLP03a]|uniref:fatty acid desaturase family protein n=1 Tax=Nostoc sp. ChiSLP03a TaxID=3075380 RepID=UPI002AD358F9|nr:fatty acid desaturase family protein [Nostoc sp. ChiSLP03a]MDZ8213387.1 fatty acid desaturase family protein [Nostoc sp. ChiSLP03a]
MNRTVLPHQKFLTALATDWLIIVATIWIAGIFNNFFVYALAVLIIGSRQHALGVLGHEGAHNLISTNRKINDWLTNIFCAWPLALCIDSYRTSHMLHHKHLGTEKDSELEYLTNHNVPTSKLKILAAFLHNILGLGLFKIIKFLYIFRPRTVKGFIGPVLMPIAFISLAIYTHTTWITVIWYLSLATSFWAIFNVRPWFEHIGVEHKGYSITHRFIPNWLEQFIFFPHNFWLHYEHHKWPNIPFYNLPLKREIDESIPILTTFEVLNQLCNYPNQQSINSGNNKESSEVQLNSVNSY